MNNRKLTKIFDPSDGFGSIRDVWAATDATLAWRDGSWWMYLAGKVIGHEGIQLMSARLPVGAPLAADGWTLVPRADNPSRVDTVAGHQFSCSWDLKGGRHCPSYVRGFDAHRQVWVERLYYAGGAENNWGPYTIGYLEWNGIQWLDQPAPVFTAEQAWERGSVYEPNVIYAEGKWKMWYVAGSNQDDNLVQGFSESEDGKSNWSPRQQVFSAEERVFDFRVIPAQDGYEAVFSRVWVGKGPRPSGTGLWWCRSECCSPNRNDWSTPVHILPADEESWYGGPWRPSPAYPGRESDGGRLLVFFDGTYLKPGATGFPTVFTLGCLELDRPAAST